MSASQKIHKKYQNKPKICVAASEPTMEDIKNSENIDAERKDTLENVNAANGAESSPVTDGTQVLDKKGIEIIGVPSAEDKEAEKVAKIEDIIIIDKECYELDLNKGRIAKIEKLDELVNIER